VIAKCLYKYAEHFKILSSAQEGFRKQKNTIRQLQNVMNIMPNAKISKKDLYLLYVDFSSAFNTIDHDKLLCIMHDLPFPEDAIEVIAELYTDAITKDQALLCRNRTNQDGERHNTRRYLVPAPLLNLHSASVEVAAIRRQRL